MGGRQGPESAAAVRDVLDAGFERSAERNGLVERTVRLADRIVRIRVTGGALAAHLLRPFGHLIDGPNSAPSLEIRAFERDPAEAGGWPAPETAVRADAAAWKLLGPLRMQWRPRAAVLEAWDGESRVGWWSINDVASTPWFERAAPFRAIFGWWAEQSDILMLHAGAVGNPARGGLLIAGASGSGKTTTCCACVDSPLGLIAEDIVLVTPTPTPVVHSVHATAKLLPDSHRRLRRMDAMCLVGDDPDEKLVAFVHEQFPGAVSARADLKGIVFPNIGAGFSRVTPMSRPAALRRLAPDSLLLRGQSSSPHGLRRIADLVRQVPAHLLEIGPRPDSAVDPLLSCLGGTP